MKAKVCFANAVNCESVERKTVNALERDAQSLTQVRTSGNVMRKKKPCRCESEVKVELMMISNDHCVRL